MKKGLLIGGSSALLIGLLVFTAWSTQAASDKYVFTARGIVKEVNTGDKQLNIYITHASAKAQADLAGNRQDFNVKPARVHKWVNGKQKLVKLSNVTVGDEVVIKGIAKSNDTYNLSSVVINDRSFEVIGKLKNHDTSNKTVTIRISTSTYNQKGYADKDVIMHYDGNTSFKSSGSTVNPDEVPANEQRVKVKGFVNDSNTWNVTQFWDNYTAKK